MFKRPLCTSHIVCGQLCHCSDLPLQTSLRPVVWSLYLSWNSFRLTCCCPRWAVQSAWGRLAVDVGKSRTEWVVTVGAWRYSYTAARYLEASSGIFPESDWLLESSKVFVMRCSSLHAPPAFDLTDRIRTSWSFQCQYALEITTLW